MKPEDCKGCNKWAFKSCFHCKPGLIEIPGCPCKECLVKISCDIQIRECPIFYEYKCQHWEFPDLKELYGK